MFILRVYKKNIIAINMDPYFKPSTKIRVFQSFTTYVLQLIFLMIFNQATGLVESTINSGMATVEKTVDEKIAEANSEMDKKMDEADKFLDSKREDVVQAVTEAGQKVNETSASAQTSLLGKAKGFLKCKLQSGKMVFCRTRC